MHFRFPKKPGGLGAVITICFSILTNADVEPTGPPPEAEAIVEGLKHPWGLTWLPDGTLLMSISNGGNPPSRIGGMLARDQAQNKGGHPGSIVRLTEDGKE